MTSLRSVNLVALGLPVALMVGALASQFLGGLVPCEMCWWQRWPHIAAIGIAAAAFFVPVGQMRRVLIAVAAGGILTSGLIGVYHAGIEYQWWEGPARCTGNGGHTLEELLRQTQIVMCDRPQWKFPADAAYGISLAGFNAIISTVGATLIFLRVGGAR